MNTLAGMAFDDLSAFFKKNGSSLQDEHETVLKSFLSVLEQGLKGELEPSYYLLSLDPGMGKTSAIINFIKAWHEANYQPASSILVGVSTLSELRTLIESVGLPSTDFGVRTRDEDLNALGLPESRHQEAKVLFTTQAMIRSRTKGKQFAETSEFHFHDRPRSLRLWDEEILPAAGVVLRRDDLLTLTSPLRPQFPEFVDELEVLAKAMMTYPEGTTVPIPLSLNLTSGATYRASSSITGNGPAETFEKLQLMVASEMLLQHDERYGRVLVGSSPTLPDDIKPLIVVDASGRVRTTYKLWEEHRGDLVRLDSAGVSFHDLNIHLWKRSAGKTELADAAARSEIADALAEAFQRDPEGDWLIVTYKDTIEDLKRAVSRACDPSATPSLHWLNWGRHHSTNEFREADNIVIVGQRTYRTCDYLGLTLAAKGLDIDTDDLPETSETRSGEHQHHLLQAVCRAAVRKSDNGTAGRCNAYLITSIGDAERVLEEVFPGYNLIPWKDDAAPSGYVGDAIRFLEDQLSDPTVDEVTKESLRDAIGMRHAASLSPNVLRKEVFRQYLADNQLEAVGQVIRLTCPVSRNPREQPPAFQNRWI